jgi:phage regulator Rha-like protein
MWRQQSLFKVEYTIKNYDFMKWIVLEENPQPDNYIAVMVTEQERILQVESKPCSTYSSNDEALDRARYLREKYEVRYIRIFYIGPNADIA